jgi:AsmA-like C-terminal region
MPFSTAIPPTPLSRRKSGAQHVSGKLIQIAILALAVLCVVVLVWSRYWPFAEARVLQNLHEASDSHLKVRAFHKTFFPSPGCILEGVVFNHGPNEASPLITIERLTIQGSYLGLLAHHLSRINAQGMRVLIPPFGTGAPFHTSQSKIVIDEIAANGASLEFASGNPDTQPLRFDIQEASLRNVGWSGPLTYRVKVHNPEPPGDVTAAGKFGVWNRGDPGETPISGEYRFEKADLSVYQGIAGTLSSTGKFSGKLIHIDISGATDTPDFQVKSGGHAMRLTADFSAYVDAIHGDTFLQHVDANFWNTRVVAQGSIARSADGNGKTALIDLTADKARIEDLLRLFVAANRPPMSGSINFQARAEVPPGARRFLEKIKLQGSFGIAGGSFSSPSTQQGTNKLSADARGEKSSSDPETVIIDLSGRENLVGGTARLSDLSFGVPGAAARMDGTYNLITEKIDLRGLLKLDSQISSTQSGAKALLLKAVEPFFKKHKTKEIVPIRISGTYKHPSFGLDLAGSSKNVALPQHKSARTMPSLHMANPPNH